MDVADVQKSRGTTKRENEDIQRNELRPHREAQGGKEVVEGISVREPGTRKQETRKGTYEGVSSTTWMNVSLAHADEKK